MKIYDWEKENREAITKIVDEIGNLLINKTVDRLDLENDKERFAALVTIGYLRKHINPKLEQLDRIAFYKTA